MSALPIPFGLELDTASSESDVSSISNEKNELFSSDQTMQTMRPSKLKKKSTNSVGPTVQNVIVLDWDDTLMPTTYLLSFIDYEIEVDPKSDKKTIKTFTISPKCTALQLAEFVGNLRRCGVAAYNLLTGLLDKMEGTEHVKIITNAEKGWLPESLKVAAYFCSVYKKLYHLIFGRHKIEVVYARNPEMAQTEWKRLKYEELLGRYLGTESNEFHEFDEEQVSDDTADTEYGQSEVVNLNLTTIGDQWGDHHSVSATFTFAEHGEYINHHQIKLQQEPDGRYFHVELEYITSQIANFLVCGQAMQQKPEPLLLEFDGYQ